jgi:anthranilate 1,2-dioxygenase small subunit
MVTLLPSLAQARDAIVDYAAAIDDLRLKEWPEMFTDPCLYRITTREILQRGQPLSIMLCDNRAMLFDRVEAIEQANIFEPHLYRHILNDSRRIPGPDDALNLETGFMVIRTMMTGEQDLFLSGKYIDEIIESEGRVLFRSRTVVLDSSLVDTLIAIPV